MRCCEKLLSGYGKVFRQTTGMLLCNRRTLRHFRHVMVFLGASHSRQSIRPCRMLGRQRSIGRFLICEVVELQPTSPCGSWHQTCYVRIVLATIWRSLPLRSEEHTSEL